MNRTHFRLQVALVLLLIALVGMPERSSVAELSVWRSHGPLAPDREALNASIQHVQHEEKIVRIGYGSLRLDDGNHPAVQGLIDTAADDNRRPFPALPQEAPAVGGRSNAIMGRARTSLNAPVPYARLVLRNLRTGQAGAYATADQDGRFSFIDMLESDYIVELVDADGTVMTSSAMVAVQNGNVEQVTVRFPGSQTVAALFGSVLGPTVGVPMTTAIKNNIAQVATPTSCISPGSPGC